MPAAAGSVIVDTGFLVALFDERERGHAAAAAWLSGHHGPVLTVEAVLSEAAFFLPVHVRPALGDVVAEKGLEVRSPDAPGYRRIATLMRKYAAQDPDWADAALVWLAEATGIRRILTVDERDFSIYRIHGRQSFDLVDWRNPD